MPTYQCTAECNHCGSESSPRERNQLELDSILNVIDQAANLDYDMVVFTGGEATLARKNLLAGIQRAASHGFPVRVVTNGYWAITDAAADRCVDTFVKAGLTEINFSTGDQHIRFVPLERVLRGTRAAVKAGLTVAIMVETRKKRKVTKATLEDCDDFQSICRDFPKSQIGIVESPWMPLSPSLVSKYNDHQAINRLNLPFRKGCDNVLTTTTVQADGRIMACCGIGMRQIPELEVGRVGETTLSAADRAAADDFLKQWIRIEGPEKILAWAATHDPEIQWEDMYAHRCQACLRLYKDPKVRQVIADNYLEKMADVLFAGWLIFGEVPTDEARQSGSE
jgi:organic radical activating enzyme